LFEQEAVTRAMFTFQKPKRHSQPWTPTEDDRIVALAATTPIPIIARELGRTVAAIEARAAILKVKTFYRLRPDSNVKASP
jgi:hypothetical protein